MSLRKNACVCREHAGVCPRHDVPAARRGALIESAFVLAATMGPGLSHHPHGKLSSNRRGGGLQRLESGGGEGVFRKATLIRLCFWAERNQFQVGTEIRFLSFGRGRGLRLLLLLLLGEAFALLLALAF